MYEYKELKRFMIRFTKFLSIFLFLLFFASFNAYPYGVSDPDQILCHQWLTKNVLGESCGDHYCGGKHEDYKSELYSVSDEVGVKGICRDYFPTYGEREMFYRTSDDPLNMELKFVRQYCWWRWWDGTTNCGSPKWTNFSWRHPFGEITWDHGSASGSWGDTVNLTFSLQQRGSDNSQTVFWGSNYSYIDYKKIKKDDKEIDNPKKVCVYYSPKFLASAFTDGEEIGCIDIPLNPAPDIYNKIIVPKESVVVDKGTPDKSTFTNPKINLQIIDSTGQKKGGYITLEYNYIDNSVKCSKKEETLGDVYCPFIRSDDPTKIHAGLQGKSSSNIGHIDRPKPAGTISFHAVHDYYIDNSCPNIDNKPSIFHTLKIQIKDTKSDKIIKEFPENGSGLRDYYSCYRRNPNPSKKDQVVVGKDLVNIYDVQFSAIIPKFVDNGGIDVEDYTKIGIKNIGPQNFKKTYIYPPIITSNPEGSFDLGCGNCFVMKDEGQCVDNNPTSKQKGQSKCTTYIVAAGKRDRSSCVRSNQCYDFANHSGAVTDVNKNSIKCEFGYKAVFNKAEQAYCHGVYKLKQEEKNVICINLDTKWPDFFDGDDRICTEIPVSFMELGKKDISYLTKYIDFTDDKFDPSKTYKDKETDKLFGKCDASLNLENKKCLSSDGKKCLDTGHAVPPNIIKGLDENQIADFKLKYNIITQYLYGDKKAVDDNKGINANVQAIDKKLMSTLGYASSKQEFPAIDVPDGTPYRIVGDTSPLDDNFPIGIVHNGCRFTVGEDGCGKNTDTAPFLGNAYFDASSLNLNIGSQFTITDVSTINVPGSTGLTIKDVFIEGKCKDGLVPASQGKLLRICRVIVDKHDKIITKSWSDQAVINPCVNAKPSEPNEPSE